MENRGTAGEYPGLGREIRRNGINLDPYSQEEKKKIAWIGNGAYENPKDAKGWVHGNFSQLGVFGLQNVVKEGGREICSKRERRKGGGGNEHTNLC